MRKQFLVGFITAGFLLSPFAHAEDRPQKKGQSSEKKEQVGDDVAQAIAFERQKDAAAARQARIEAKHPTVTYSNAEDQRSADRDGQTKQEQRK